MGHPHAHTSTNHAHTSASRFLFVHQLFTDRHMDIFYPTCTLLTILLTTITFYLCVFNFLPRAIQSISHTYYFIAEMYGFICPEVRRPS